MPGTYSSIYEAIGANTVLLQYQGVGTHLMILAPDFQTVLRKHNRGWAVVKEGGGTVSENTIAQLMGLNEGRWAFM